MRYRWSRPRRDSQSAATTPLPEEECIGGSLRPACESRRPLQSWVVPWLLSLFLSGTIFGFRRSPRFPGLLACVCCTTNHDWRSRLLVAQNHPLRIFSAVALKNAYSLGSEGYPPPRISARASRRRTMICDFRHTTTPCSCNRFRLMVTHCRVAPTMWARSACVNAAPMRIPSGTLIHRHQPDEAADARAGR